MKAVMISIQPKWVEKIASGEKTIEVRKTRPKIDTPFKCYIYETKGATETPWVDEDGHFIFKGRGQVIGEFVCDKVYNYFADDFVGADDDDGNIITEPREGEFAYWVFNREETCIPYNEILKYGKGKTLYGWHISDLKIYDKPRELSEFYTIDESGSDCCIACVYHETPIEEMPCRTCTGERRYLYRAPQSWQYVEE